MIPYNDTIIKKNSRIIRSLLSIIRTTVSSKSMICRKWNLLRKYFNPSNIKCITTLKKIISMKNLLISELRKEKEFII